MSQHDFFRFIRGREGVWELVDGRVVEKPRTNQRHRYIAANTLALLHTRSRAKSYRPTSIGTGILTTACTIRFPDLVVDCGARNDEAMLAMEPRVVVDVLSPLTRGFDPHRRLFEYKSTPKITSVLLVDTETACVLVHDRRSERWDASAYRGLADVIELPAIETRLALSDIYDGVELGPAT
ncbi:Uma2 family endonuclease [Rhizobium vallis]|nr:Uma2 family endonuclease [Rhizobium vallis]